MNIKAIAIGTAFIIFTGLLLQLVFLLAATGYTVLTKTYPDWQNTLLLLAYLLGGVAYFFCMALAGYICADIAKRRIYLHNFVIAAISLSLSLVASFDENGLTLNTLIFIFSGITFTLLGGYFWQRQQN